MKAFSDLEQSKKLSKILPLESADMHYARIMDNFEAFDWTPLLSPIPKVCADYVENIPCWSLAALLGVLPEGVIENYYVPNLQKENGKYSIAYGNDELLCIADNPIDACYEMILKLKEKELI